MGSGGGQPTQRGLCLALAHDTCFLHFKNCKQVRIGVILNVGNTQEYSMEYYQILHNTVMHLNNVMANSCKSTSLFSQISNSRFKSLGNQPSHILEYFPNIRCKCIPLQISLDFATVPFPMRQEISELHGFRH